MKSRRGQDLTTNCHEDFSPAAHFWSKWQSSPWELGDQNPLWHEIGLSLVSLGHHTWPNLTESNLSETNFNTLILMVIAAFWTIAQSLFFSENRLTLQVDF